MKYRLAALMAALLITLPAVRAAEADTGYADVSAGDWYAEAVEFVTAQKLMEGTGEGRFSPGETVTRGMMVTVLYRLAGSPEASPSAFPDVDAGAWYADAVGWASGCGLVSGCGDGRFAPEDPVTREQIAVLLFRYALMMDLDIPAGGYIDPTGRYADRWDISGYAEPAMTWAVGRELLVGSDTGTSCALRPGGSAARGEVAVLLLRFYQRIIMTDGAAGRDLVSMGVYGHGDDRIIILGISKDGVISFAGHWVGKGFEASARLNGDTADFVSKTGGLSGSLRFDGADSVLLTLTESSDAPHNAGDTIKAALLPEPDPPPKPEPEPKPDPVPEPKPDPPARTENEAYQRLMALEKRYPSGMYWNHSGMDIVYDPAANNMDQFVTSVPCNHKQGVYDCNHHDSVASGLFLNRKIQSRQCLGFASMLSDEVFGKTAPVTAHISWEKLRVGDAVRLTGYGHSFVVLTKENNAVTVAEVNADFRTCVISWGRRIARDELERYARVYVTRYPDPESDGAAQVMETTGRANLRSGPAVSCSLLRQVPAGTRVCIINRKSPSYYLVQLTDGTKGYLSTVWLKNIYRTA